MAEGTSDGADAPLVSGADIRTFLFADMRGWTRFTQEHGDEAASALAGRFADLVEARVPEFEGELLELTGDGALCVFRSARQALRASVELQRRLRTGSDKEAAFPIGVGMGLDAGEAVPTHGGYRGASLNLAARLCALAKPGEILASETVIGLASRVDGMRFLEGRSAPLKGMARPVRYVVVEPAQPLPPVPVAKASSPRRTGLPFAIVGAVGIAAAIGVFVGTRAGGAGGQETIAANAAGLIEWPSGTVVAEVPVAGRPGGVALGGGFVWVTDSVNDKLLKIDPTRHLVIDQIPVGADPTGVVVGGGAVWVANSQEGTISRVNLQTSTVVQTVRVGNGPTSLAFGDGSVWVLNSVDATVSRISATSGRAPPAIPLSQNPSAIAYGLGSVWVTSEESGLLLRIDPATNQVVQSIPVGNGPVGVAVGGGAVWVANVADRTVSKVNVGSGAVAKIAVPGAPQELAYTDDGLWSGNTPSGTVSLIQNNTVVRTLHVESDPASLAGDSSGLWVGAVASLASHRGGTLRVLAQGVDPQRNDTFDSIDPGAAFRVQSWQLLTITNDGLVGFKHAGGPAGQTLVPDLATSLPVVSDGGKAYTFQLRSGIRYSNGHPVLAQDFRYAIERELQAGTGFAYSGVQLAGAQACSSKACDLSKGIVADDRTGTIVFHLAHPDPDFLFQLALPWGDAVPTGSPKIDVGAHPLPATGPYKISTFVPHKRLVLVRNPYFHEWSADAQPNGFPNRLVWRFGLTPGAETTAIERGRADIMVDSPPPQRLGELVVRFPAQAHPFVEPTTLYLFLNTRIPPFNDPLVRHALSLAVNRGTVVRLWGGNQLARVTCQVLPPGIQGYSPYCPYTVNPNASGVWKGPDMPKARRLIASSGTEGQAVSVHINADDPMRLRIAQYIVRLLQRLGYRASLHTYPNQQTFYIQVGHLSTKAQIGLQGWQSNFPRASDFFTNLFTCASYTPTAPVNINTSGFCNHRIDKQIKTAEQLQTSKPASAAILWARVDRQVVDQAPDVFLFNPSGIDLTSARVGNYQRNQQLTVLLDQLWVR